MVALSFFITEIEKICCFFVSRNSLTKDGENTQCVNASQKYFGFCPTRAENTQYVNVSQNVFRPTRAMGKRTCVTAQHLLLDLEEPRGLLIFEAIFFLNSWS